MTINISFRGKDGRFTKHREITAGSAVVGSMLVFTLTYGIQKLIKKIQPQQTKKETPR